MVTSCDGDAAVRAEASRGGRGRDLAIFDARLGRY